MLTEFERTANLPASARAWSGPRAPSASRAKRANMIVLQHLERRHVVWIHRQHEILCDATQQGTNKVTTTGWAWVIHNVDRAVLGLDPPVRHAVTSATVGDASTANPLHGLMIPESQACTRDEIEDYYVGILGFVTL